MTQGVPDTKGERFGARIGFAFGSKPDEPRFRDLAAMGWNIDDNLTAIESDGVKIVAVDLRYNADARLTALGQALEAERGALIAIVADNGSETFSTAFESGATHVLAEPFDSEMLHATVLLAVRHVDRLAQAGGRRRKVRAAPPASRASKSARAGVGTIQSLLLSGPASLMLVGLKRFDAINADFGRATGDALLIAVERRIAAAMSDESDGNHLVARAEGADFVIIHEALSATECLALANRIVAQLERPFMAGVHFVALSACIGIVDARAGDLESDVMRRAKVALEAARDDDVPVRVLSEEDEGMALFDAGLDSDLLPALLNNEIDILFQPQVSVTTGQIVGVEALARWYHPNHGELGAETLFSVAKRSGCLIALSTHVQKLAATKAAAWPEVLQTLRLSINVTAEDIARPVFADSFLAMIDHAGFPRNRLTVEITENGLIEDLEAAATLLATLRAGGCRVAIDDFGTGYSSLAYLKALPLDYLKIDKHLAQDIAGTPRDRIVVRGVIDMARSLGLAVIAEGVETEEQLTLLAQEGCNYYQGFLCAVPLTVEALAALVTQQSLPAPSKAEARH